MTPNRTRSPNTDTANRALALQIAAQLPPDYVDALTVLELAADIVRRVYGDRPERSATVVRLVE